MGAIERRSDLTRQLATAAAALLGAVPQAGAVLYDGWEVDGGILYYSESDSRVTAIEPALAVKKSLSGGRAVSGKLVLDSLTGATPSGATPTTTPQTFTRPSGDGSYVVAPGDIPLDDTFHDTRIAVSGNWLQPIGRLSQAVIGANFSKEYDFLSYGSSLMFSHDFNQRNTTLSAGLSGEFDTITPKGGIPVPFASMGAPGTIQPRTDASDSKSLVDVLLGVTQVINARTLAQVNYSLSRSSGYMTDPYKILSVIDPVTGVTVDNVFENRPDTRSKHALYGLLKRKLKRDVVSGSYRYFFDDWGIKSHTLDLNYRWMPSERWWLEPHVRLYSQSEADFYRVQLFNGLPVPKEASADHRLAAFNGYTFGLQYGWLLKNESRITLRAEYYTQMGENSPSEAVGIQQGLDFFPDLKATIFQIQYSF